jgi:hypothetical protein
VALAFGAVTALSVALRWMVPLNPSRLAVAFDDGLFERLAVSLTRHDWLGPLATTTLAKGPGYPLFVALAARVHVPLQVAQQSVYLFGAGAVALCIASLTRRPWIGFAVYAVLALDPANYNALSATITRENIYTGLALGFVAGVFLALAWARRGRLVLAIAAGALAGLTGGGFWLTREEGVWVVPSVLLVGVGLPALALWPRRRALLRRETLRRLGDRRVIATAAVGVTMAVTFAAPIIVVHNRNERAYGARLTTDFTDGTFPKAYATWSRVRGVKLRAFVPVDTAQRRAAYAVSPAARELEPFLEDPANGWRQWGCAANRSAAERGDARVDICDDYPGGAEPWALRDAAAAAGHFADEPSFQGFWGRVDRELRAACDDGRLRCARALPASLQFAQRSSALEVARSAAHWAGQLVTDSSVYDLYGPGATNAMPAADRDVIGPAVPSIASSNAAAVREARSYQSRRWPHLVLGALYRLLVPLLVLAALVKLVGGAVVARYRFRDAGPLLLATALLGGVVTRLMIFGIVDTTQYFTHIRYHLVTRSFLLAAALVVLASPTVTSWTQRLRPARRARSSGSGAG